MKPKFVAGDILIHSPNEYRYGLKILEVRHIPNRSIVYTIQFTDDTSCSDKVNQSRIINYGWKLDLNHKLKKLIESIE